MNNLIYAGVILFGAITLVIEARRNYSVSAKHHPFAFYGILEHLEARHLCSPREWNFGFYVYSLLYLISYAVLLSSTELVELIYKSSAAANLVGATGTTLGPESDPFDLSGTDYGKPLFISAFIIAFYSVGATRNIELHIRTLAHRLAGVPRGVYQVLDRLQDPDFLSETTPPTGPLMASFREKLKPLKAEEIAPKSISDLMTVTTLPLEPGRPAKISTGTKGLLASLLSNAQTRLGREVEDNRPKGKEQYLFDICKALRVIDLLRPAIIGGQRATHFPLLGMKELGDISATLDDSIGKPGNKRKPNDDSPKTLHDEIDDFKKYDEASLERLREKAIEVANSARAVFAVYFICNSRTVLNVDRQSALQKVRAFADRGYKVEQNSFAGSLFFAAVIATFAGFFVHQSFKLQEVQTYPNLMAEQIYDRLGRTDNSYIACRDIYYVPTGEDSSDELPDDLINVVTEKGCQAAFESGLADYRKDSKTQMMEWTFFDNLALLLMVAAVVQMSIFEKDVQMDQNAWRRWTMKRVPYVRLLTGAILPALAGVFALSIGFILRLFWNADFDVTTSQIEFLFVENWQYFVAYFVPCFVLSISVFVIIDKHDDWALPATLSLAVLTSVIYVFSVWLVPMATLRFLPPIEVDSFWMVWWNTGSLGTALNHDAFWLTSYVARDLLILTQLPVLFLILFAFFVEFSETSGTRLNTGKDSDDTNDSGDNDEETEE
ncbi:hypothetical protein [Sedimentitalea todarodis]|uniref:Uncharacterized protein n=1 Tax=Sedimentitalea todarodis TaxID=1631240 RepID=A0ABU3VB92_9RHOB|nr:hypothetical protein [Sedimentitalea todarodis]MDU9003447.1 hypothetical protein [Sedimentitalea todarodis]